jgi:hypothetical protein
MRRLVLCCLVNAVGAYPSFLVGSGCAEPIAIANGQSPGFGGMGGLGEAVHKGEGDEELLRELQPAVPRRRLSDQPGDRMSERQT